MKFCFQWFILWNWNAYIENLRSEIRTAAPVFSPFRLFFSVTVILFPIFFYSTKIWDWFCSIIEVTFLLHFGFCRCSNSSSQFLPAPLRVCPSLSALYWVNYLFILISCSIFLFNTWHFSNPFSVNEPSNHFWGFFFNSYAKSKVKFRITLLVCFD